MSMTKRLIDSRKKPLIGIAAHFLLKTIYGIEIPNKVKLGNDINYVHSATGLVVHPDTIIKDNVSIFHQVTLGRADPYVERSKSKMERIIVEEGAVICPGAKILCKKDVLTIGRNTIIGANAVLTKSTGENEIWAGIPARKISDR